MAYRDTQMESEEFLGMILALKRSQMRRVDLLPVITVMPRCSAFIVPGDRRLRSLLSGLKAGPAAPTC
jgi:hypothetical protein